MKSSWAELERPLSFRLSPSSGAAMALTCWRIWGVA